MELKKNVPLARFCTWHVGGPARYFKRIQKLAELKDVLSWKEDKDVPLIVLGGGSNILFSDDGFDGLVVKMENRELQFDKNEARVQAGVVTKLFSLKSAQRGLAGVEYIAGIPGTIGGAIRGNAGSRDGEVKDSLREVTVLHRTKSSWEEEALPKETLDFGYRDSLFKKDPSYVIWESRFSLSEDNPKKIQERIDADLEKRMATQPYNQPAAGSVFKNPSPDNPAGQLIEKAGLKGKSVGGAKVSEKHANFIVTTKGCESADIKKLIGLIKSKIFETKGIKLEEEVEIAN